MSAAQAARFEAIFDRESTSILGYLMRRVESPEDAADLMAEVFTIAWRRIESVPAGDEARLWLYGIARNVLANHRRGNTRRTRLADHLREHLTLRAQPTHEPGAVDIVRTALAQLPSKDREILTLSAWELSPAEIAVVLNLEPTTVRARLTRAKARLRTILNAQPKTAAQARPSTSAARGGVSLDR